jgi:signal transduction histidine kinase
LSDKTETSDFTLAGLVHDLNNVFETISEAAEVVSADPKWAKLAEVIYRNVERGRRIVGGYADQNRSEPELEVVVDRAIYFLQDFLAHMPGTKVKVIKKVPAGVRVQGDPSDWERVFMNLFLNAAQAMKESGGGEITVEASAVDSKVITRVTDNGPGIPETILPKIFKPRFSTKNLQTGMGLHIVHTLVNDIGGSVSAENREGGKGAVFTLTAPAPLAG